MPDLLNKQTQDKPNIQAETTCIKLNEKIVEAHLEFIWEMVKG